VPAEFIADRIAFMKHDFSLAASRKAAPVNRQRVTALIGIIADMLADGRPFLFGNTLSAADLAAYHPLWFARSNGGEEIARLIPLEALAPWMDRIGAIGHGERTTLTADDALAVARDALPDPTEGVVDGDPGSLVAGDAVLVQADQANDPVRGTLVAANAREIVVRHSSDVAGTVHVHLPRLGYAVVRDGDA
jgi:glutathione S-transferase